MKNAFNLISGTMADLHSNMDEQPPHTKRRQSNPPRPSSTDNAHSGSHTHTEKTHTEKTHTGSNKRKQSNSDDPSLCPSKVTKSEM